MDNQTEWEKMATQVFSYMLAGCLLFIVASVLIGIFQFIPIGPQ
jgi:hypothetical protein